MESLYCRCSSYLENNDRHWQESSPLWDGTVESEHTPETVGSGGGTVESPTLPEAHLSALPGESWQMAWKEMGPGSRSTPGALEMSLTILKHDMKFGC